MLRGGVNNNFATGNATSKGISFSVNPSLEYFNIKSTDKKQVTRSGFFNPGFSYQKQNNQISSYPKRNSFSIVGGDFSTNIKVFSGLRFIETGYSVGGRAGWTKERYADSFLQKANNKNASVTLTFGIGKGRLENVTDAQMAFYILNDLQQQKLLSKDFSASDMDGLAKTITNINNTRLFDYRRKRRFELQQIDSFLQKSLLLDACNINYFTTLTDNWLYAYNPYRVQGKQKYIRLQPRINYQGSKIEQTNNGFFNFDKNNTYNIIGEVIAGIDDMKSISIKQQFNKGISLGTSYNYLRSSNNTANNFLVNEGLGSSIIGYLEWGYFPNTRTNVFANIKTDFSYNISDQFAYNTTNLFFNANYFVGYNTRFFVNESLSLNTPISKSNGVKTFLNNNISIGIEQFFR